MTAKRTIHSPSAVFGEFVGRYADSVASKDWERWCYDIPLFSGGFVSALYDGNILTAIYYADDENIIRLRDLLFPNTKKEIKELNEENKRLRRLAIPKSIKGKKNREDKDGR